MLNGSEISKYSCEIMYGDTDEEKRGVRQERDVGERRQHTVRTTLELQRVCRVFPRRAAELAVTGINDMIP